MVANKTFRSVWGLSFRASIEDDSGLLLKEVELMVLGRRLWNWAWWLPRRSWLGARSSQYLPSRALPNRGGWLPKASWLCAK